MSTEQDLTKFDTDAQLTILRLQRLAEEAVDLDRLQHETVAELRARWVPWKDIARALGVTRQAATQRFAASVLAAASETREATEDEPEDVDE